MHRLRHSEKGEKSEAADKENKRKQQEKKKKKEEEEEEKKRTAGKNEFERVSKNSPNFLTRPVRFRPRRKVGAEVG